MKKQVVIRKGTASDLKPVHELVKELAEFEKSPHEVTNTLADMERDGFGDQPVFRFFVATCNDRVIGMALYYQKYSTWKGKGIYLEDIIVNEQFRNQGIGRKLFMAVLMESKRAGAKQLHWQVLNWNNTAIDFYKKYNPSFDSEWVNCKMNQSQINSYNL